MSTEDGVIVGQDGRVYYKDQPIVLEQDGSCSHPGCHNFVPNPNHVKTDDYPVQLHHPALSNIFVHITISKTKEDTPEDIVDKMIGYAMYHRFAWFAYCQERGNTIKRYKPRGLSNKNHRHVHFICDARALPTDKYKDAIRKEIYSWCDIRTKNGYIVGVKIGLEQNQTKARMTGYVIGKYNGDDCISGGAGIGQSERSHMLAIKAHQAVGAKRPGQVLSEFACAHTTSDTTARDIQQKQPVTSCVLDIVGLSHVLMG
jgi:hypothetical protein